MKPPRVVQIEVTSACNIQCRMCEYVGKLGGPSVAWEQFERILPVLTPGCRALLFGPGEPLLHPRFLDMVRATAARGALPETSTNGVLLTPQLSAELKEAAMYSVVVSIEGAVKETHEYLQPGVDSEAVWANLAACAATGIRTVLATIPMRPNLGEFSALLRRAQEAGVRSVILMRLKHSPDRPDIETLDPFLPGPDFAENRATLLKAVADAQAAGLEMNNGIGI